MSAIEIIKALLPIIGLFLLAVFILSGWMAFMLYLDLKEEERGNPEKDGNGEGEKKGGEELDRIHF